MLFPIEVTVNRPEEVVEIRDLIAQVIDYGQCIVKALCLVVRRGGESFLQRVLPVQDVDRILQGVGLFHQVVCAVFLVLQVLDVADASRADLKSQGGVVERGSQRPGHGLHLGDAGGVENSFCHSFQVDHVGRITHIVVGFDHQQFGIEPGF